MYTYINRHIYIYIYTLYTGWCRRRHRGARGGGGDRLGSGHSRILYKVPEDYTKPQQTIQRYKRLTLTKNTNNVKN